MKDGWEYTTFGSVMKPAKSARCGDRTDLPILSITMRQGIIFQSDRFKKVIASNDTKDYKIIKNGQLVIAFPIDEGLIYTQDVAEEGIMSPAYNIWDVDYSRLNRKFLNLYFHCPWTMRYYKSKLRGTTQRRRMIPKEDLLSLPIPIPPLPTQERIVSELDCINSIIEKKREQIKELDALAQSIFYHMFGDPVTNEKGWEVKKLGEVCDLYQPKTISSEQLITDGNYPVYGANGVIGRYNQFNHEESEVLVTCRGATCGTINVSEPYSWINGNAMVVRPTISEIRKQYLRYVLTSIDWKNVITGAAQPQITRQSLSPVQILIPPLSLQQSFATKIAAIEKQKELIKRSIAETGTLLASRMQYYFG